MELLYHGDMRPELHWLSPTVRLGFDTASLPVPPQQLVDKAHTHPEDVRELSLGALATLIRADHFESEIR